MNRKTAQLIDQVQQQLSNLPEEKVLEVLDFVQFLVARTTTTQAIRRGSPEALKKCIGVWKFKPGELDEILADIEQSRLMELESQNDQLST
jgi:hypothetical protein